jgi:hypothetical protein
METTCVPMDFKDLAELSERLNANTDQLNVQLKAIEERLNALSLGVEAWVTTHPLQQEFTRDGAIVAANALVHGSVLNPRTALDADDRASAPPGPTRTRTATELGYMRFQDGWKLAVRTVNYTQTKDDVRQIEWDEPANAIDGVEVFRDVKPLLRASRTVRMLAVDRIPQLLDALYGAASAVDLAIEKARRISDSLK